MKGFVATVDKVAKKNAAFRRVLYTGSKMQLVLMALKPGEEIGLETHKGRDQFFQILKGKGELRIDRKTAKIKRHMTIIVPAGARHNITNTGRKSLRLYTVYAPPEHADRTVHATPADAQKSKEHFDGRTTEPAPHLSQRKGAKARTQNKRQPTTKTPPLKTGKKIKEPSPAAFAPKAKPPRNLVPSATMTPTNVIALNAQE